MWSDVDACRAIVMQGCASSEDVIPRRSFKILVAWAYEPSNCASMWADETARSLIVQGARYVEGGDVEYHLSALRALQALSVEPKNKEAMWADVEGARAVLLESAMLCGDAEQKSRCSALMTLKNLTTEMVNCEGIWNDAKARELLVYAAAPSSDIENEDPSMTKARATAMGALRNIAGADGNKEAMWADEHTQAAILGAAGLPDSPTLNADAREAREHGMAAIRHFAAPPALEDGMQREPLWKGSDVVQAVIASCAKLDGQEASDKKAREHAVAALRFTVL